MPLMPSSGAATAPGCPCGTGRSYGECCGPLHRGRAAGSPTAQTAEALMRSRYSAFVQGDDAYLLATWHPSTRPAAVDSDPAVRWEGLEILAATHDTVEFVARYRGGMLRERSAFAQEDGQWFYVRELPVGADGTSHSPSSSSAPGTT